MTNEVQNSICKVKLELIWALHNYSAIELYPWYSIFTLFLRLAAINQHWLTACAFLIKIYIWLAVGLFVKVNYDFFIKLNFWDVKLWTVHL